MNLFLTIALMVMAVLAGFFVDRKAFGVAAVVVMMIFILLAAWIGDSIDSLKK